MVEPKEIKWGFLVASSHKRCGNLDAAFREYEKLHDRFPESVECLRHLISACEAIGDGADDPRVSRYQDRLDKLLRRC